VTKKSHQQRGLARELWRPRGCSKTAARQRDANANVQVIEGMEKRNLQDGENNEGRVIGGICKSSATEALYGPRGGEDSATSFSGDLKAQDAQRVILPSEPIKEGAKETIPPKEERTD